MQRGVRLAVVLSMAGSLPAWAAAPADFSPRVQELLRQMTLDEKLSLTAGARDPAYAGEAGYLPGVPRLGIPPLRMSDGPGGVYVRYEATAMPLPIALAATFSTEFSRTYGEVLGRESRVLRTDVFLGPMVNLQRVPNWGRNATSYGEDPLLIGRMAAANIEGIQSTGTMATPKHFIANNQSLHQGGGFNGADGKSFEVDERTLHEIYLPGFEASFKAGAAATMAAYNKTNGYWNAENRANLTGILRDELGWNGFVVSDWHANRSLPSIVAGLDVEMPGFGPIVTLGREGPKWGPRLKTAVESGQVPMEILERAAGRVLNQMDRFGMLNGTRIPAPDRIDVEGHAAVARRIAAEGAVLLKNERGALPLASSDFGNLLVIGPTAAQLAVGSGVSGFKDRFVAPLDALRAAAGPAARISYSVGDEQTGTAIPASALTPASGTGTGLTRVNLDGSPSSVDAQLEFLGARAFPVGRSHTWRGTLRVPTTGEYALQMQSWGGSGTLKIDGQARAFSAIVRFGHGIPRNASSVVPTKEGLDNAQVNLRLEAGKAYAIEVETQAEPDQQLQVRLAWITPEMRKANVDAAVAAARNAEKVLLFAWARSGEFDDPDFALRLPNEQDALIDAVATANPNTVIVMNSASPHDMPWADKVRGILYMWFPGQEGGDATADVLLGRVNPGGKLPFTFPRRPADVAAYSEAHPERYTGNETQVLYSEGIFTGYRHYDQNRIRPLFPFGFGLSYTTFAYSDLKTAPAADGFDVTFTLRNTGAVAGAEVAQVYLARPARPPVPMAPKALAAFARVALQPGESKTVTVRIEPRSFEYWDVDGDRWLKAGGTRAVQVGASSADIRLNGRVDAR